MAAVAMMMMMTMTMMTIFSTLFATGSSGAASG